MNAFMNGACKRFCGYLGTTNLVNKIKIYTSLIKVFHFDIYTICSSLKVLSRYWILFGYITWINVLIITGRKKWCKYACFTISSLFKIFKKFLYFGYKFGYQFWEVTNYSIGFVRSSVVWHKLTFAFIVISINVEFKNFSWIHQKFKIYRYPN